MSLVLRQSVAADGRYLNDAELQPLEGYVSSFALRFNAYSLLQEHSAALVLRTLRQLIALPSYRKTVQENGAACQRDMGYTLEMVAKAVLLDDAEGFTEGYVLWLQNITQALHKQDVAVEAYRLLAAEITATLPSESAALVAPYLSGLVEALATGQ